jgi:hypothetical protein
VSPEARLQHPPPQLVPEYSVMDPTALQYQFGYRPPTTKPYVDFNEQAVNTGDSGPNHGALTNQQQHNTGDPGSGK